MVRAVPSHLPRCGIPAQRPLLLPRCSALPHQVPWPRACPIRCPGAGPAPRLGRFTSATSNSLAENLVRPASTALSARKSYIGARQMARCPLLIPATPPTLATRPVTSAMSKSLAENLVQPATTALSARDFDIKSATGVGAAPQRGDGGTARVRGAGERVVSRVGAGRYSADAGCQKRARSRSESWVGSVAGGVAERAHR